MSVSMSANCSVRWESLKVNGSLVNFDIGHVAQIWVWYLIYVLTYEILWRMATPYVPKVEKKSIFEYLEAMGGELADRHLGIVVFGYIFLK